MHTVQQLLAVDRIRFRYLRSVSDKVRREIRERAKRLAEIRPELKPGGGSEDTQTWASVDRLAELLIPRRPAGDETSEDRLLELYLGLEPADGPVTWPTEPSTRQRSFPLFQACSQTEGWLHPVLPLRST